MLALHRRRLRDVGVDRLRDVPDQDATVVAAGRQPATGWVKLERVDAAVVTEQVLPVQRAAAVEAASNRGPLDANHAHLTAADVFDDAPRHPRSTNRPLTASVPGEFEFLRLKIGVFSQQSHILESFRVSPASTQRTL